MIGSMPSVDDAPATSPLGGWVLHSGSDQLDLTAMLDRFGLVYRHQVATEGRAAEMAPGQPCFLLRTDRSRVVGLWAVGEVVGPAEVVPATMVPAAKGEATGDAHRCVEVELLALDKPIALDKLIAKAPLSTSELATWDQHPNPLRLGPAEVRAIEAIEFWLTEPTDDQRRAFDQLLAAEDAELA